MTFIASSRARTAPAVSALTPARLPTAWAQWPAQRHFLVLKVHTLLFLIFFSSFVRSCSWLRLIVQPRMKNITFITGYMCVFFSYSWVFCYSSSKHFRFTIVLSHQWAYKPVTKVAVSPSTFIKNPFQKGSAYINPSLSKNIKRL